MYPWQPFSVTVSLKDCFASFERHNRRAIPVEENRL
jgi:hypothetical protein